MILLFLLLVAKTAAEPPFLFPHGYFDSHKVKPFDAIYLNLMAASNLEYGGTPLEELDALDAMRKKIPRPADLERNREEDDPSLDREAVEGPPAENKKALKDGEATPLKPKTPFSKIRLQRMLRDDPMEEEANPFEDIATRAPPRSQQEFQRLRKKLRPGKKTKKAKRPHKATKQPRTPRPVSTSTVPPTLIPTVIPKIRRLPNNPYGALDISQPNIIPLPIPPEFEDIL